MNTNPIQNYILKSERNLHIASAVNEALNEARQKVTSDFLDRLNSRLKRKLKGWEFELWGGNFFVDAYPGFSISKPEWKHYSIALQCGEYGQRMVMGIVRDTNDVRKLPHQTSLLEAMQKIHPSAKSHSWWEARVDIHSPAADWRGSGVLWRMHKDNKFLEEVADQLLEIAKVSETIISRLARNK